MTSVFLTRRAMLSSGALAGIGALLAACGQQANNEAAATTSAAPSETDWVRARNYGIQTGDMQYVWPYMLDTFKSDIEFLNSIEKLYKEGGWVIEGTSEYQAESDLMYDEETKEYWVLTRRLWTYGLYIHPNGKMRKRANTGNENETFMFRYRYKDGYWYLSEYRSNEELRKQGFIQ